MSSDSLNSVCRLDDRLDMNSLQQAEMWLHRAIELTNRQLETPKELMATRTLIIADLRRVVEALDSVIHHLDKTSGSGTW